MDRSMANICESCPIFQPCEKKATGSGLQFIKTIENRICPFCQAHEKVYGRKAHETVKY